MTDEPDCGVTRSARKREDVYIPRMSGIDGPGSVGLRPSPPPHASVSNRSAVNLPFLELDIEVMTLPNKHIRRQQSNEVGRGPRLTLCPSRLQQTAGQLSRDDLRSPTDAHLPPLLRGYFTGCASYTSLSMSNFTRYRSFDTAFAKTIIGSGSRSIRSTLKVVPFASFTYFQPLRDSRTSST